MKIKLFIASCLVLLVSLVGSISSEAQSPPPDLGETNLLNLACSYLNSRAEEQSVKLTYCRRYKPDVINETTATIYTKIRVNNSYNLMFRSNFRKSLWWVDSFYR